MNLKAFLVDTLGSALELGIATPDDVMRHVTADVLAQHLPRPLWARLLTACLGAGRVDAQLVVETIGVPNLCEHVPPTLLFTCVADVAARALGRKIEEVIPLTKPAVSASGPATTPLAPPPPEAAAMPAPRATPTSITAVKGPAIPTPASVLGELFDDNGGADEKPAATLRSRTPTAQRFRTSNTGINRPLGSAGLRRPQAAATSTPPRPLARRDGDADNTATETSIESGSREIAVDDSQLVEWSSDNTALGGDDDIGGVGRKR